MNQPGNRTVRLLLAIVVLAAVAIWLNPRTEVQEEPGESVPAETAEASKGKSVLTDVDAETGAREPADREASPEALPAIDAPASLLVRVRWADTNLGAEGIGLRCLARFVESPSFSAVAGVTDRDGLWVVEGVVPGQASVAADRAIGSSARVEVQLRAGQRVEVELVVPRGRSISGRVVDEEGTPLAGAEVVWHEFTSHPDPSPVARTDPSGRFRAHGISKDGWVSAWLPGYRSSVQQPIEVRGEDHDPEVELVLHGPAGWLEGQVRGTGETPLADARVFLGWDRTESVGGSSELYPPKRPRGRMVWTDAEGRFTAVPPTRRRFEGSSVPLSIEAAGHAPLFTSWAPPLEGAAVVMYHLGPAASLTGRVVDDKHLAVAGAAVSVRSQSSGLRRDCLTDADGFFVHPDLPREALMVTARHRSLGIAELQVDLAESPPESLLLVLKKGISIRGRLVWAPPGSDADFSGWIVSAIPADGSSRKTNPVEVDAEGNFEIAACESIAYRLFAGSGRGTADASAILTGVGGGDQNVVFEVDAPDTPGELVGKVLRPTHLPSSRIECTLHRSGEPGGLVYYCSPDGSLRAANLCPGEYRLQLTCPGAQPLILETVAVRPGEVTDLGPLTLEETFTLRVTVEGIGGATRVANRGALMNRLGNRGGGAGSLPGSDPFGEFAPAVSSTGRVTLKSEAGHTLGQQDLGEGPAVFEGLSRGPLTVQVTHPNHGEQARRIELTEPTTELHLELQPGVETQWNVPIPQAVRGTAFRIRITNASEASVVDLKFSDDRAQFSKKLVLEPGAYQVLLEAEGREFRAEAHVEAADTPLTLSPLIESK